MANTKETKKTEKKNNVHEVIVKIEGVEWTEALDKAFKSKQKDAKVDGFRKGKVPRNIYEKHYGKESLFFLAAEEVLQSAYAKAMEESNLIPVVQPSVDIKDISDKGVEFTFKIITKPEVKIKNYKGLGIKPEEIKVTKDEIDHEIGHLLEEYTELVTKEGEVKNGDVAVIDFEGFKDGKPFDGGKGENYSLEIGSNTFIPGFEEQVNEIKEKVTRELDKEFFEDLAMEGVHSKETLEKEVEKNIKAQKEADNENKYIDHLLEEVAKNVEVDIPQEMVDEETTRLLGRFEQQMAMQGISLDIYYQFTKSSEEDLRKQMDKEAYQNVLYRLMLEEIMNLEKIEVSQEEASKEAEELAKKYKMDKEDFLKQFGGLEMIQYDLEMHKVIDLLKELNK